MEQRYGGKGVVGRVLPPDDVRGATQIGLLRGEVNRDALRFVKHRVGWVPDGVGRREQEGAVAISILQSAMVLRLNKYANVRLSLRLISSHPPCIRSECTFPDAHPPSRFESDSSLF